MVFLAFGGLSILYIGATHQIKIKFKPHFDMAGDTDSHKYIQEYISTQSEENAVVLIYIFISLDTTSSKKRMIHAIL